MLLLPNLIAFAETHVAERPNLEPNAIVTAEHDEAGKLYKDVVNAGSLCTLFVLIPSHDGNAEDEDNTQLKNNLSFIIMKKTDAKAGQQEKLNNFALCQLEILALAQKIKGLVANFGVNCIFKDIDLNTIQINPLPNYLGANGYSMDFSTETNF